MSEQIVQSGAGLLIERVAFDKRSDVEDGYGNVVADWVEQFTTRAQFIPRFGGEAVMAARLESRQPVTVRIRRSVAADLVDNDYRMRDLRTGEEYQIRTVTREPSRGMLEIFAEKGVAV